MIEFTDVEFHIAQGCDLQTPEQWTFVLTNTSMSMSLRRLGGDEEKETWMLKRAMEELQCSGMKAGCVIAPPSKCSFSV